MCRRAVEMWCLLTVVMLTLCADQHRADDVLIPALSEFPTESMSAFNPSSTDYYHSLFVDSHNDGVLFLGAQDRMFKLNAKNISINYVESVNLTASGEFFDRFIQNRKNCGRNHGRKDEQEQGVHCANHIRTIYRVANSNEIYVCGTGAYSPQEFYLNDKLELIATANRGRAKCPHDPTAVYVFAYVTQGNPENIPALYTAVAIDGIPADFAILRPDLYYNRTSTSRSGTLLRTEPDAKWINTAGAVYVVGVFDIGEYVFYFFRELAYEASNYCGKTYYSRVARICKQDQGGRGIEFTTMFTSFLKARLICSIPGTVPYYFNEIYDVQYNASSGTFYALFQANSDGPWGSAVCKFSLSDINNLFNTGVYLGRDNVESAWLPPPAEKFPKDIHPGQCANNSKDLALSTYIYKKLYPLMKDPVTPSGGHPMYYSNQIAFTKLQVDHMSKYTILYLYSKGLAEVHQVAVWNNSRQYETVSKWRPFASIQAASSPLTVWTMLLHTVDQNKWLYLAADVAVIQLNTEQCQLYTKCFDCIRDPHCGWNTEELRCQRYQSGLSQDAVTACSSSTCFTEYQWAKVIPGMSLHLNCSSPCLPDGAKVTWLLLPNHATSAVTIPVGSDANYVLSADNGLVILSVNASQHVGTFQCMYNNHIVTQHNISLSVCRYGNWNVWLTEYRNYCKMFDQYVMDYNEWQDLKDKCQSSNCIDTANKGS